MLTSSNDGNKRKFRDLSYYFTAQAPQNTISRHRRSTFTGLTVPEPIDDYDNIEEDNYRDPTAPLFPSRHSNISKAIIEQQQRELERYSKSNNITATNTTNHNNSKRGKERLNTHNIPLLSSGEFETIQRFEGLGIEYDEEDEQLLGLESFPDPHSKPRVPDVAVVRQHTKNPRLYEPSPSYEFSSEDEENDYYYDEDGVLTIPDSPPKSTRKIRRDSDYYDLTESDFSNPIRNYNQHSTSNNNNYNNYNSNNNYNYNNINNNNNNSDYQRDSTRTSEELVGKLFQNLQGDAQRKVIIFLIYYYYY